MNQRYILFQRAGVYGCEYPQTGKQSSLRTRDKAEAITLLHTRNETARQARQSAMARIGDELRNLRVMYGMDQERNARRPPHPASVAVDGPAG